MMDDATLRELIREEAREAMREVLGEALMRALGVMPVPEPDPRWSMTPKELAAEIQAADLEELESIEASVRSHPDGLNGNLMTLIRHRWGQLEAERSALALAQ